MRHNENNFMRKTNTFTKNIRIYVQSDDIRVQIRLDYNTIFDVVVGIGY